MTRGARVASVVVAALLVASLATVAVTGTEGATADRLTALPSTAADAFGEDTEDTEPTVSRTMAFDRRPSDPGNVTVTVEYALGEDVGELVVTELDGAVVAAASGFEPEDRYDGWAYRWDGTTDSPEMTVTVPVNASSGAFDGLDFADTGSWALLQSTKGFSAAYYSDADTEWVYSWRSDTRFQTNFESAGPGHLSHGVGFLGEYETYAGTTGDQSVTLVVPVAASPNASPAETFALLAESRGAFQFGGVDDQIAVYVGPAPLREGGYYRSPSSFWVSEDSLDGAGTLVHEYVHTRQAYRAGDAVDWFDEGSANYYRELFQYEQGLQSYDSFRSDLRDDGGVTGTLADRETWSAADLEYHHGERVAAALDARIRQETAGERTLQDVLRRMNEHDGEVDYAAFQDIVAAVAGTSLDEWLDEYVRSEALPILPDDPALYTLPSPNVDSDGDGLPNAVEREHGTSVIDADTDGDGLADGAEVQQYGTDPTSADTDGDGLVDGDDPAPTDVSVRATTTVGTTPAESGDGTATAGGGDSAAGDPPDDGGASSDAASPGFGVVTALLAGTAVACWLVSVGRE